MTCMVPTMINLLVNDPASLERGMSAAVVNYGGRRYRPRCTARSRGSRLRDRAVLRDDQSSPVWTLCWIDWPVDEAPWAPGSLGGRAVHRRGAHGATARRNAAEVDEVGEEWLRGRNIMAGYWRRPEETPVLTAWVVSLR